jgi:hypothetical protein
MAASTHINVSSHGDSSASVNVHSTSSSTSENSNTSETNVMIESNGVKKEYHSTNGENVNMDEGNIKVTIKNSGKTASGSPTPKTLNDEVKDKVDKKVEKTKENAQKKAIEKKNVAQKKLGEIRDQQKANLLHRIELFFGDFKKRFFE